MQDKSKKKKWYKHPVVIVLFGIPAGLVGLVTFVAVIYGVVTYEGPTNNNQNTSQEQETPKQRVSEYEVKIAGNTYASPTERRVTFTVANTGDTPTTPSCYVEVSSEDMNYIGYDYINWNSPVEPGDRKYFEGLITVTNNGAEYASLVNVSCSES